MTKTTRAVILAAFALALGVLAQMPQALSAEPLKVAVSIAPQKYFLERIGGTRVEVSVMVPPGASPETYTLTPLQMKGLSGARLYFAIGAPFERAWLKKLSDVNPGMTVVSTEEGIEKLAMDEAHDHGDDSREGGGDHALHKVGHGIGTRDPHIWLSPPLVMVQARNILAALLTADPANGNAYEADYKAFIGELADLDIEISRMFSGKAEKSRFMVFHPAWAYFAKAYGLTQVSIEKEGKTPTSKQLARLIRIAGELRIKVLFVQPQFSAKSAQSIADAIGGKVVPADPLSADWAANLRLVASQFREAVR